MYVRIYASGAIKGKHVLREKHPHSLFTIYNPVADYCSRIIALFLSRARITQRHQRRTDGRTDGRSPVRSSLIVDTFNSTEKFQRNVTRSLLSEGNTARLVIYCLRTVILRQILSRTVLSHFLKGGHYLRRLCNFQHETYLYG